MNIANILNQPLPEIWLNATGYYHDKCIDLQKENDDLRMQLCKIKHALAMMTEQAACYQLQRSEYLKALEARNRWLEVALNDAESIIEGREQFFSSVHLSEKDTYSIE